MSWNIWVQGFKDYISNNISNQNTDSLETTDNIITFKGDAGADQYDRVTTIDEVSKVVAEVITTNSNLISDKRNTDYKLSTWLNLTHKNSNTEVIIMTDYDNAHGIVYYNGYIYVTYKMTPGVITKTNVNDLTDFSTYTFPDDGAHVEPTELVYVPSKNRIYVVFFAKTVSEIDLNLVNHTDVIDVDGTIYQWYNNTSVTTDDTYLYITSIGTGINPITNMAIWKYLLEDFTLDAITACDVSQTQPGHAIEYDGSYIYATNGYFPYLCKYDTSTNTIVEDKEFSYGGGGHGFTDDFAMVGDYLYLGLESDKKVLKVNKNDFDDYTEIDLTVGVGASTALYSVFYDGEYVWVVFGGWPSTIQPKLSRIDPNTNEITQLLLSYDYTGINEIATDGQRLFFTTYNNDSKIIRMTNPSLI